MQHTQVGRRYAEALAGLIEDPAALEDAARAVRTLADAAVSEPADVLYWRTLSVPRETKEDLLGKLLEAVEAPEPVRSFVGVLLANNRVANLPEIADALDTCVFEQLGRAEAYVTTARPLSDEQQEALRGRLAEVFGKDVRLRVDLDEGLIGGLRVQLENRILDHSVRGRLRTLTARLQA